MATAISLIIEPLHRGFLALTRRRGRSADTRDWAASVENLVADLKTLNASTEQDFLAVGEKLIEFRSAAHQISFGMTALVDLVSGGAEKDASHALSRMLDESIQRSARISQTGEALGTVGTLAGKISRSFSHLRNTVSIFRNLCTLTRIESSRLGSADMSFSHLADEVKPLSESIQASGDVILAASTQLDKSIRTALKGCSALQARQTDELPPLIEGVTQALASLEQQRMKAYDVSARQAARYTEIGTAIEQLVTTLQTHDITRQQIEHVGLALEQLVEPSHRKRGSLKSLPSQARAVLALQSHQLVSAREAFSASIERIEKDLESISASTREMANASQTLMEASGGEQNSFFEQMDGCFKAILGAAGAFDLVRAEIQSTAGGLDQSTLPLRAAMAQIRKIEIQIQRIAINAAIGAIHIGPTGDALSLIAAVMQEHAQESNINTEVAAVALDAICVAVHQVSLDSGHALQLAATGADALQDMRVALSEMRSCNQASYERVKQIADAGTLLSDDINALRKGFSAGRMFEDVVLRTQEELDRLQASLTGNSTEDDAAHAAELHRLAANYTMQAERDVHQRRLNVQLPEPVVSDEIPGLAPEAGDFGDNVELF